MTIMNNKKIIVGALALSLILMSLYLVLNSTKDSKDKIQYFNIHSDLKTMYSSVQELSNEAQQILEVEISEATSLLYEDVVFTISSAKIIQSYKGKLTDKEINILQTGGLYNQEFYTFNENEVFKQGDKAIVFLRKYDGPVHENAYYVLGEYQGKFMLKDTDKVIPPLEVKDGLQEINGLKDLLQQANIRELQ